MGKHKDGHKSSSSSPRLSDVLRAPSGRRVAQLETAVTPRFPGDGKEDAAQVRADLEPVLADLQERLFAAGKSTPETAPRVLLILQGLDTAGKGGVIRHAVGLVDPQGISLKAFKRPTEEELAHHFLWRAEQALPGPGMIGVFDRSHYEDILIGRVNQLAPADEIERRYDEINAWEASLVEQGYTLIKCCLLISPDVQKERLLERLRNPEKYWKYNPGDVDTRMRWEGYEEAFTLMLERCSTDVAPWYVIPSDNKWYRDWAVAELLRETLADLDLGWPEATFDVAEEIRRVEAT